MANTKLIGPCPECGRRALVYRNARIVARESVHVVFARSGSVIGPRWDRIGIKFYSKVVRCDRCHAIRGDLVPDGAGVRIKGVSDAGSG